MNKRGALELSMSTIIVIVLGVTLLILGLAFVRTLFGKVTTLSQASFDIAEQEIQGKMGAIDKIYVSSLRVAVTPGKASVINVGIQNIGTETGQSKFSIKAIPGAQGGSADWFTIPVESIKIAPGEKQAFPIEVSLPSGTPAGKSYGFTLDVTKNGAAYASKVIIVTVNGE